MRFKYTFPIVFVALVTVPLVAFLFLETESKETFVAISGVASFLFGLLGANTIRERQARLDKIVLNAATERGELVFIAEGLQLYSKKEEKVVLDKIDAYLMASLDLETHHYNLTDREYTEVCDAIIKLNIEEEKQKKMYDRFLTAIEKIETTREYSATLFEDRIPKAEWTVLYFLIVLIYTSLLFANTGGIIAFFIIASLALVISYLLVVAIKLDKLNWKIDEKIFEPYEQTFEAIGLMRYYPKPVVDSGVIYHIKQLPSGTKYRIGDAPNYPEVKDRIIEIKTA
jgi:hypothetical protein